jgi:hypothetical protein
VKKRSPRWAKMKVSADGAGVASHAGCELLRELAAATGLVGAWDKALIGTLISNGGPSVVDPRAVRANALVGRPPPKPTGPSAHRNALNKYNLRGCRECFTSAFMR